MLPDVGAEGQLLIKQSRVLVIGAGGLGCPVLQYLAAAGIGTIGIVDFDVIELHNLHRQILYETEDIGNAKVLIAAARLNNLNPNIKVIPFNEMLSGDNAERIIKDFDIILDGTDNFNTRYLISDTCMALNKPSVYGSILRDEGQLGVFNYKGSKGLRDIYPEPPNPEDVPSCSEAGVLGTAPGIIGMLMVDMVLKVILGKPVEVNTLMLFNIEKYEFKKLRF